MELINLVNSFISNDLTQMVNFHTPIHDSDPHNPALLDFFLLTLVFVLPSLGNSDNVAVSVSIYFPSDSKRDASSHRIAYDYSRTDWDGLRDHLRDFHWRISSNSVLLLLLVNFVSGFRLELTSISLIVNIMLSLTHLHGFQLLVLMS